MFDTVDVTTASYRETGKATTRPKRFHGIISSDEENDDKDYDEDCEIDDQSLSEHDDMKRWQRTVKMTSSSIVTLMGKTRMERRISMESEMIGKRG